MAKATAHIFNKVKPVERAIKELLKTTLSKNNMMPNTGIKATK